MLGVPLSSPPPSAQCYILRWGGGEGCFKKYVYPSYVVIEPRV